MNELLQIVLRQYCETCESSGYSFFWNVIKDFILPILIAGFAGYMVYWAFVKESRRDILIEQARKDQEHKDKLFYFSALVKSCTDITIKQKEFIEDLAKEIDKQLKPFLESLLVEQGTDWEKEQFGFRFATEIVTFARFLKRAMQAYGEILLEETSLVSR